MMGDYYILEMDHDGSFSIIKNQRQDPRELPYIARLQNAILESDAELDDREKAMSLIADPHALAQATADTLRALVRERGIVSLLEFWQRICIELDCFVPLTMADILLEQACETSGFEYVRSAGATHASMADELAAAVRTRLNDRWCVPLDTVLDCTRPHSTRMDPLGLIAVNALLGRRGIFSVGLYPVLEDGEDLDDDAEMRIASEPTGIEDVGLWGSVDDEEKGRTYSYTGNVPFSFRERLYLTEDGARTLYAVAAEYVDAYLDVSVLWMARRLAQSPMEVEVIRFLLLADRVEFHDPNDVGKALVGDWQAPVLADLRHARSVAGLIRSGPNRYVSKEVAEVEAADDAGVVDEIARSLDELARDADTDGKPLVISLHSAPLKRGTFTRDPRAKEGRSEGS